MRKRNKFFKDEIGNKYNRLLVVKQVKNDKYGNVVWECKCDCGNIFNAKGSSLRNSTTKSCGCFHVESMKKRRLGDAVFKIIFRNIKTDCKKRKIPLNLDLEDIKKISILKCYYCLREPYDLKCRYQRINSKATNDCLLLNGIDRIVPNIGYIKNNVVPCCKYCNRAKSDLSLDEFKKLIILLNKNFVNEIGN